MALQLKNLNPVIFLHDVGIGTTSPTHRLHVRGAYASPQLFVNHDNGGGGIFFHAQGASSHFNWLIGQQRTCSGLEFTPSTVAGGTTFNAPAMVILSSTGNVGIGTASPTKRLSVAGGEIGVETNSRIGYIDGDSTHLGYFMPYSPDGFVELHSTFGSGGVKFFTGTSNAERVCIDSTGNVGIGTATPLSKTEVYNSGVLSAFVPATSSTWRVLQVKNNQRTNAGSAAGISFAGDNTNGDTATAGIVGIHNNTTGGDTDLAFLTAIGNVSYERLRINASGYVGIGTSSPGARLEVSGSVRLSGNGEPTIALTPTYFGYSSTYGVVMVGQSSGSSTVSIGYNPIGNLNGSFNGDGREVLFRRGVQFVTPNAANTGFHLTNLVLLDGYVGIGTPSPSYQLQLSTDSAAKPTSSQWTVASDARIKADIESVSKSYALARIEAVRPVSFRYIPEYLDETKSEDKTYYNFIAQELEQVFPECVRRSGQKLEKVVTPEVKGGDGKTIAAAVMETVVDDIASVDSHSLIIHLIAAVQELSAKVKQLESK